MWDTKLKVLSSFKKLFPLIFVSLHCNFRFPKPISEKKNRYIHKLDIHINAILDLHRERDKRRLEEDVYQIYSNII